MRPRQICRGLFANLTENFLISLYFLNRPPCLPRMRFLQTSPEGVSNLTCNADARLRPLNFRCHAHARNALFTVCSTV